MGMQYLVCALVVFLAGCAKMRAPEEIEWRSVGGKELSEEEKRALAAVQGYLRSEIRSLLVGYARTDSADLHHIEYELVAQEDGYVITGGYIARYHSTGRLGGFPEGAFNLKVHPDGTVENLHLSWE